MRDPEQPRQRVCRHVINAAPSYEERICQDVVSYLWGDATSQVGSNLCGVFVEGRLECLPR
jgi:hypothetical protein